MRRNGKPGIPYTAKSTVSSGYHLIAVIWSSSVQYFLPQSITPAADQATANGSYTEDVTNELSSVDPAATKMPDALISIVLNIVLALVPPNIYGNSVSV